MRGRIENRVYYKQEKESGKLRMGGGSWSINLDEIDLNSVDGFLYKTEYASYSIKKDIALKKGFNRFFGGENKFVVPIKWWDTKPHNPPKKVAKPTSPPEEPEKQKELFT